MGAPDNLRKADSRWSTFAQTILEFPDLGGLRVDLRRSVGEDVRARLQESGLRRRFAVVTACNPGGQASSPTENLARAQALEAQLREAGRDFVRADGVSPDGAHREPGVAAALDEQSALGLARAWEQLAVFWYDGRYFWILDAGAEPRPSLRLPLEPEANRCAALPLDPDE